MLSSKWQVTAPTYGHDLSWLQGGEETDAYRMMEPESMPLSCTILGMALVQKRR